MPWLPESFAAPERAELRGGHHLRQIRADDVDIDYPAVMGSRRSLWARYGEMWGWPPETMTYAQDRKVAYCAQKPRSRDTGSRGHSPFRR